MKRVLLHSEWGFDSESYNFWSVLVLLHKGRIIKIYSWYHRLFFWVGSGFKPADMKFYAGYEGREQMARDLNRKRVT